MVRLSMKAGSIYFLFIIIRKNFPNFNFFLRKLHPSLVILLLELFNTILIVKRSQFPYCFPIKVLHPCPYFQKPQLLSKPASSGHSSLMKSFPMWSVSNLWPLFESFRKEIFNFLRLSQSIGQEPLSSVGRNIRPENFWKLFFELFSGKVFAVTLDSRSIDRTFNKLQSINI